MSSRVALVATLAVVVASLSCQDSSAPMDASTPPDSVAAKPLGMHQVVLTWERVATSAGYVIERRANLTGPFASIKEFPSGFTTQYTDESLDPETIYGYRVVSISLTGIHSAPSLVVGARTAPVPGIVASVATAPIELASPAGYGVTVTGNGATLRAPLAPFDNHRFGPLAPGVYQVALSGVPTNCNVAGGTEQTDTVTDQGLATLQYAPYSISCRDPHVGRLTVHVTTTGDSLDADGYSLTFSGIADDASLPDSLRAYFKQDQIRPEELRSYEALRPGNYTLSITGLAGNCALQGAATLPVRVNALDDLSRSFAITCEQPEDPTRPYVWRSTWSSPTAAVGAHVSLAVSLDLSRTPGQHVNAVQSTLGYDKTVVRLDSVAGQVGGWQVTPNTTTPGSVLWLGFQTGAGPTDTTTLARFYFTVIGATGATTTTATSIATAADANTGDDLKPKIRRSEGTFTVASGGSVNQPPVSRPGGPYSGVEGTAISFSGATSSDPDGSITVYGWSFGDGTTGTGATPTHAYASAGSYTVTLTVTDNGGLTATATTTASVAPTSRGGNLSPVAQPNGPYSGVAGTPLSFSSSGSSDPDGTIASYAWDFGDGSTGSGSAPAHTYASAGTYTVQLTVTDNQGAPASAATSATIASSGGSRPLTWRSDFGPVNPVDSIVALTITLDLSADLPQTTGPEALQTWVVDSLRWDPAVLRYFSFNFGLGSAGSVNPTDALAHGKLLFSGVQSVSGSTGVITIARIQFKVIGASGAVTNTATSLGTLLGTPATGSFSYGAYTQVVEGSLRAP